MKEENMNVRAPSGAGGKFKAGEKIRNIETGEKAEVLDNDRATNPEKTETFEIDKLKWVRDK